MWPGYLANKATPVLELFFIGARREGRREGACCLIASEPSLA